MNFVNEYGGLISIAIAIFLAIFLYKKIRVIPYGYYLKTIITAFWNLLKEILNFRNKIGFKQTLVNFYNDLPEINKSPFYKNITILYFGCLTISLLDYLTSKSVFEFIDFFIIDPIENLMVVVFFIGVALLFRMLGLHKKDGFINSALANMNNQSSQKIKRNKIVYRKKSNVIKREQPIEQPQVNVEPEQKQEQPKNPKTVTDSAERKACFNCTFWTGERNFRGANHITYLDEEAKCSPKGGRPHANMPPRGTCNKFLKLG